MRDVLEEQTFNVALLTARATSLEVVSDLNQPHATSTRPNSHRNDLVSKFEGSVNIEAMDSVKRM
jgi:hypothetical protein